MPEVHAVTRPYSAMRPRYFALALLFAPALASAQGFADLIVRAGGTDYPGREASFGPSINRVCSTGPLPVTPSEPADGCGPLSNADEVSGTIALIERGTCSFPVKVHNAQAAGAEAVLVYNSEGNDPDTLITMGGECPGCAIYSGFVSRNSGLTLLDEALSGGEVSIGTAILDCDFRGPSTGAPLSTREVTTAIYDTGSIGDGPRVLEPPGFQFGGDNGLSIGTIVVGHDGIVVGNPYTLESEFRSAESVYALPKPFEEPSEDFDQGFALRSLRDGSYIGVSVTVNAYAREGDAFVVLDLNVENTSGDGLDSVYVGLFADWNVGDPERNLGRFDAATSLVYVYDDTGTSSNYFGVAALDMEAVSGWTLAADKYGTNASLFEGLTTEGAPLAAPQDARTVIGVGPFDLAPGETANVRFAMLAGASEAEIIANAQLAQNAVVVAVEAATPAGTAALAAAYPNPFAETTTLGFALPTPQAVRLAVYDVLGREVAVLADGARPAGTQAVAFDASGLPSGVYVVRLNAGGAELTQRLTVVR